MDIIRLRPTVKNYIWAGKKLAQKYEYAPLPGTKTIAEAWVLSFHKDGLSKFATLAAPKASGEILDGNCPRSAWGSACDKFKDFPLLIKLIDSGDNLSVQVHPSDEYAQEHEGQYGKTEFWYVLDAEPNAGLYIGFKHQISKAEYAQRIADGTLQEVLQFFPVKPGSHYFIPAGTVHAIGKGVTLVEVQQSSNVTYRVFDYNRKGADGAKRELHIDKAIDVSELKQYARPCFWGDIVADCKYFTSELQTGDIEWINPYSFTAITFLDGFGAIGYTDEFGKLKHLLANDTDTYFIPAGTKVSVKLLGTNALFTYVKE